MQEIRVFAQGEAHQVQQDSLWVIPWEWIIWVGLAGLALLLFASELHLIPMGADEARNALTAWRFVDSAAPGARSIPASPLLFVAQTTTFALFGGGESMARIATALAGVALVLTPVLLRTSLGTARALLLSALLACSPLVIITARSSTPMIWAALLALLTLWAGGRYWETRRLGWGIAALTFLVLLALTTSSGGTLLAITLLAAASIIWLSANEEDEPEDAEDTVSWGHPGQILRTFPWGMALGTAALITVVISTLFLTYPQGLSAVGEVLLKVISGISGRASDTPAFYPMLISLFYEPWLWILGIAVAAWLSRGDNPAPSFLDRFAMLWLALNSALALLYRGAAAEDALWLTLPLALLVSRFALVIFAEDDSAPGWARWLIGALAFGLLAMGTLAFQGAARSIGRVDFQNPAFIQQIDPLGIVILVIVLAFTIVGYFLVRSFWESDRVPQRAGAIALIAFALFTGIGAGWRTAVTEVDNPVDFWQRTAPSRELLLLRQTLMELAERSTRGYPEMPITVISAGNPLIEWVVRDFSAARFVTDYAQASNTPVLLALATSDFDRSPPLTGSYVGQDFTISRAWSLDNLRLQDVPQWWAQHRVLNGFAAVPTQANLWVRTDIYAGGRAR